MATAVVVFGTRGLHTPGRGVHTVVVQPPCIEAKLQRILDIITPELQLSALSEPQRKCLRERIQENPALRAEVDKRLHAQA
jgi:hypothetical protein